MAKVVTLQVGQCGNQLGSALFSALAAEADAGPEDFAAATREVRELLLRCIRGFALTARTLATARRISDHGREVAPSRAACWSTWSPRCGAVQTAGLQQLTPPMPPQVVAATLRAQHAHAWSYDERGALTFESGSGNNWARGFNTYGPKFRQRACELLRREVRGAGAAHACSHSVTAPHHARARRVGGGMRSAGRLLGAAEHGRRHGRGARLVPGGNAAVRTPREGWQPPGCIEPHTLTFLLSSPRAWPSGRAVRSTRRRPC